MYISQTADAFQQRNLMVLSKCSKRKDEKKIFGAAVLLSSESCKSVLIWTKISVIDLEAV